MLADLIDCPWVHMLSEPRPVRHWSPRSHNLLRAAGTLAAQHLSEARGATLRRQLVNPRPDYPTTGPANPAMRGAPTPGQRVLLFDDHGGEQAITAAERLASAGCVVELVTPDRMVAQDAGGVIYPDYFRILYAAGAVFTADHILVSVRRSGAELIAVLANAFTDDLVERTVDRVVVEQGTLPVADVYEELVGESKNPGETDLEALVAGRPQEVSTNPAGAFQLFRIGDAVAGRNIHAAIYDARRLCMHL